MSVPKIFISYSHRDESVKDELVQQLTLLKNNGTITIWEDRQILPSQRWDEKIEKHLESSSIAIFLISPDFLSSTYINQYEIPNILAKEKKGEILVVPIIIRECSFGERVNLSQFQAIPKDAKPITLWDNRNEAWRNILTNLKNILLKLDGNENQEALPVELSVEHTKLVILYDQQDRTEWQALKKHFFVLTITQDIEFFDIHEDINSGNKEESIKKACIDAHYILCFITPNFWRSCYFQLKPYLCSGRTNQVIPLKIENTAAFAKTPLNLLKSYPSDDRFVSDWDNSNDGYADIGNAIVELV